MRGKEISEQIKTSTGLLDDSNNKTFSGNNARVRRGEVNRLESSAQNALDKSQTQRTVPTPPALPAHMRTDTHMWVPI